MNNVHKDFFDMRNFILMFSILMSLFLSCSKGNVKNLVKFKINIDSISLEKFDDIHISVSLNNRDAPEIKKVGICWGKSPEPTLTDSSRNFSSSYSTIISKIGESSTYYFRAFIQTNDKVIYSESRSIATGGLNILIDKEYNNGRSRNFVDVKETSNGLFIALVNSIGIYSTNWPELILFDKSGNVMWSKEYNQYHSQAPINIFETKEGFLLITTDWTTTNNGHIFTMLDKEGNVLWEKKYGVKKYKEFLRILDIKDESLMIALREYDNMTNGIRENCVITNYLINLSGNIISSTTYSMDNILAEGPRPLSFNDSADRGFVATYSWFNTKQSIVLYDIIVKKISLDYKLLWEKKYGGEVDEHVIQISPSLNKNWNLLGYSHSFGLTRPSSWLFQVNNQTGDIVWQTMYSNLTYGISGSTLPTSLCEKDLDSYYISGNVGDSYATKSSAFIAKLTSSGKTYWDYTFDNKRYGTRASQKIFVNEQDIYLFSFKTGPTSNSPTSLVFTKLRET